MENSTLFKIIGISALSGFVCYIIHKIKFKELIDTGFPLVDEYFNNTSKKNDNCKSVIDLTKNTPIIKSSYLSNVTGHNVYIKCENLLPFTSKDRIIRNIIFQAIKRGEINKSSVLYEGSSGSTCYSVAMISTILGLKCKLIIPDDVSEEKLNLLKSTKAELIITKQCPYSNFNDNYVRLAKKLASEDPNGFFVNQFENEDNYKIHYEETGPEILSLMKKQNIKIDAFVSGAGTGGTIAGLSLFFKNQNPKIKVILSDISGSGLYSYVKNGVLFTSEETEANRQKYRYYTKLEGIGVNFLTTNFKKALIDDSVKVSDEEAVEAAREVYINDGLFAGGSTGVNFAAIKLIAKDLPKGSNILTISYDSGLKYLKKLYTD